MKGMLPLLLLVLLAGTAHADATKVEVDIMCPIVEVLPLPDPNLRKLRIARGSDQGLVVGARGDVYGMTDDGKSIDKVVARAQVTQVGPTESFAEIVSGSAPDIARVAAGGHFETRALVPSNLHRGTIFELYVKGIEFLDNYKEPIVKPRDLFTTTTDAVERLALAKMVECGREVVEFTLDMPQLQTRTRWKGQSVSHILTNNEARDYLEFLRFVMDYPGKYIGKQWKISETYATWLINFSPPAHADRYDELAAAKGPARAEIVEDMKDPEVLDLLEYVRGIVQDKYGNERLALMPMLVLCEEVAKLKHGKNAPPLVRAELLQMRARILQEDRKRRPEALKAYRDSANAYFEAGTESARLDGVIDLNNLAGLFQFMERDDEALAVVAEVRAKVKAEAPTFQNPMYRSHFELAELYPVQIAARIAKNRGQYREVIDLLTPLVERAAATGARGAREREMDLLDTIASAWVKLGDIDRAAAIYTRIDKLAAELGDDSRRAKNHFAVGDLFYGQSRYVDAEQAFVRSADVARQAGMLGEEAKAFAAQGQSLWQMGKYAEALERHERGMKLREQTGDKSGIAWQLVQTAKIKVDTGDREAARAAYEKALGIYQELDEKANEAETRVDFSELHMKLKRPNEAEKQLLVARDIYKKLKRVPSEASVLQSIAGARVQYGDDAGAEKLVRESMALLEKTGDKAALFSAKVWLARIIVARGDAKGSRSMLAQLMPKDPAKEPAAAFDVLVDVGFLDLHDGDPQHAAEVAAQALKIAEDLKDVWRTLRALGLQRAVLGAIGDHPSLLAVNIRSRDLARESGNRPQECEALQQMSWTLTDLGRLSEAKATALEALALARKLDDPYQVAWSLNALSRVHNAYNETQAELDVLNEAFELMKSVNFRYGRAAIIFNRALIYARLRDLQRALDQYDVAEKEGGTALDVGFRLALLTARAEALMMMTRMKEAEPIARQALALAQKSVPQRAPHLMTVLARILSEVGRHDEAIALATEAVALNAKMGDVWSKAKGALGRVLVRAGKDAEARKALEEVIADARKQGGALPWEALYDLAVLEAKQSERKNAIDHLKEAVKEIEADESILAADSEARANSEKVQVFRLLVKLLLAEARVEDAFQYLERSKVAELRQLDQKSGAGQDQDAALAIELDVQEKKLQKLLDSELAQVKPDDGKVKKLDDLIAQARKRRAEFMESVDRKNALFDRYAVRPLQLQKLQEYLAPGVLIVAPVMLEDSLVVFAMTKDALTHYTTPMPPGEIDKLVANFVREADPKNAAGVKGKASLAKMKQQGAKLYDLLLRPAMEAMGRPKTLVVSPTGALRYLPFAALYDGEKWVIESTDVVNVTALDREKFASAAPRGSADTSIMALVDPDGTLPAARVELAEVKKVFANIDIFEGKSASTETLRHKLRVPGYEVVHFATHGRLDAQNPEMSNILLADASLSYADIPTLAPKKTNLVVLSACQTAVLSGGSGLEIAGLAYQFQLGRVHSVMATLWEVDDGATADLMARFYQEVRANHSYAEALALTQRAMLKKEGFEHPGYWASFVLMGTP